MTPEKETEKDLLKQKIRELEELINSESNNGQLGHGYLMACKEEMRRILEWAEKNLE